MHKRFLNYSRTQPARTILAVVSLITLLAGLFIFTPWFVPVAASPAASASFGWAIYGGAIVNTLVAIPAIWAVKKNTPRSLATGSMCMFLWYTFVTLSRLTLGEPTTLLWVPTLIIAVVMSVLYIEQGSLVRRHDA